MKAKNLFFGALACLAFAACSNEDEPIVNGGAQAEGGQYVAINVVSPVETRSTTFENGTGDELLVDGNDVLLLFFKGENFIKAQKPTYTFKTETGTSSPQIANVGTTAVAYLVPDETGGLPDGLIAVLNAAKYNLAEISFNGKTLSQIQMMLDDYDVVSKTVTVDEVETTNSYFLMTNSVYKSNPTGIATISEYFSSQEEALEDGNPVNVYVERVVAKVNVTNNIDKTDATETVDNEIFILTDPATGVTTPTTIVPEILGYHLAATADKSYLIKNIDTNWIFTDWEWDDYANRRSYWAKMPSTSVTAEYRDFADRKTGTFATFYCQENTGIQTSNAKTELVVLARLQKKVTTDGTTTYEALGDLLRLKGNGAYWTLEGYKKYVASELAKIYKYTGSDSWDWTEKIQVVRYTGEDAEQWEAMPKLLATITDSELADIKNIENEEAATATAINEILEGDEYVALYWKDARTYYHVMIKHDGPVGSDAENGIVRNHVYNLSLSKVQGLGTPVYDPEDGTPGTDYPEKEDPIIPDDPVDSKSYISAQINVLKWRVLASQDVELGGK